MAVLMKRDDPMGIEPRDMTEPGEYPSVLVELFGKSPEIRLLDFFMDHPFNDHMQSEIASRTGMNPRTVRRVLLGLVDRNLIFVTRKIAKSTLYKLNSDSLIVKQLKAIERTASELGFEE